MDLLKTAVRFSCNLLILLIASGFKMPSKDSSKSINYDNFANQIFNDFAKEIHEEFGFICNGTGGSMPYDIEYINISFIANRKASIEEARNLEVLLTEKFIEKVNSHQQIRPFLRVYPVSNLHAEISIMFFDTKNKRYFKNSVRNIFQIKNKIYYEVEEPKTNSVIDIEEPYEEALKIVKYQKNQ